MEQRANLVLLDGPAIEVYGNAGLADELGEHLVLGPDHMYRLIRRQERVDARTGWLDDLWAEGGAVLDLTRRRVLWYDNPSSEDLGYRRLVAEVLARVWTGWTVTWAYDGAGDLAAAVGLPRAHVRNIDLVENTRARAPHRGFDVREVPAGSACFDLVGADRSGLYLVTTFSAGRMTASLVDSDEHVAWQGTDLAGHALCWPTVHTDNAVLVDLGRTSLLGGTHIDPTRSRMSYWTRSETPGLQEHLARLWPGYEVRFLQDRVEEHLAVSEGFVACGLTSLRTEVEPFRKALLSIHDASPDLSRALAHLDSIGDTVDRTRIGAG